MKLFPKLSLTISALIVVSLFAVGLWVYVHDKREMEDRARQEQTAILNNLAHMGQEAIISNDRLMLVTYIQLLHRWNPNLISASVINNQGQILAHSEPRRIGQKVNREPVNPSYGVILSLPILLGNHQLGAASVIFSQKKLQEELDAQIGQLQKNLLSILGIVLVLGILAAFGIAHSWTHPIQHLASVLEQIGRGDWNIDLGTLERRKDEIGFLSNHCHSMAVQLAHLDQIKDDFVSAVSHEFRSPLSAIASYLDRIKEVRQRGEGPDRWASYLEPINLCRERLERFVDDLLDTNSLKAGKLSLDRKTTDLASLAKEVVAVFEIKLQKKKICCGIQSTDELPCAYVDPGRIRQVLSNLISNALKFTPEGGHIDVKLEPVQGRQSIRISVVDNGIGIASIDQLRVFNKFEQVRTAREQIVGAKGSGLGLSICRALVELHSGTIGVKSEPGKGSTFYFTLPVSPPMPSVLASLAL
jgi:signal transduction histidine kinase